MGHVFQSLLCNEFVCKAFARTLQFTQYFIVKRSSLKLNLFASLHSAHKSCSSAVGQSAKSVLLIVSRRVTWNSYSYTHTHTQAGRHARTHTYLMERNVHVLEREKNYNFVARCCSFLPFLFSFFSLFFFSSQIQILFFEADMQMKRN